jgi:NAD-dependent SIR2 family protein deacetylase
MQCLGNQSHWYIGYNIQKYENRCPVCSCHKIKPNVIFFNEVAPEYPRACKLLKSLSKQQALIIIGTSLQVFPIKLMYLNCTSSLQIYSDLKVPMTI